VDLYAWDAGTDSGVTFRSDDLVTAPPQVITRIEGYPIAVGGPAVPLGRMVFTRK
jgi:hypothetical protein